MRKFCAPTMREALMNIREALGENAVILESRTVRDQEAQGSAPAQYVEVWAEVPGDDAQPPLPQTNEQDPLSSMIPEDKADLLRQFRDLQHELQAVHERLGRFAEQMPWLAHAQQAHGAEPLACGSHELVQQLPMSGGIRLEDGQRTVAVIGPHGAGKSTLIARLARHFTCEEGVRTGIITTDTCRAGAIEQLAMSCRHLDIPLEVVYHPENMADALDHLSSCRLVLIDTPGCNPRDTAQLHDLEKMLESADPHEVHLVLPACYSPVSAHDCMTRFRGAHPDHLVLTRIDEASPADLLPAISESGLLVSYTSASRSMTAPVQPVLSDLPLDILTTS